MPTYEYKCENCGHQFEQFQSIKEDKLSKCPGCGENKLKRLIGTGGGLIFKGSGFYLTDYKNKPADDSASKGTEKKSAKKEESSAKSETTTDTAAAESKEKSTEKKTSAKESDK